MRKYWFVLVIGLFIGVVGCTAFDIKTGADGKPTTQAEEILTVVSDGVGLVSPLIPQPAGGIALGIAAILGLIGTTVTSIVARKRGGTLKAIINGVDQYVDQYYADVGAQSVKASIRESAIDGGYQKYLDKLVQIYKPNPPVSPPPTT